MKSKLAICTAALATMAAPVFAEYPEKPVSFVVPFPPGDLEDVLTRLIAEDFQEKYGVAAAVVNKPGGGGGPFPGAVEVANAPSDGYTIGSFVIDVPVIGHQIDIPPLTPEKFDPVGIFVTYPFVLAASNSAPYSDLAVMAEYAQNNELALGHFGDFLIPTQVSLAYAKTAGFEWGSDAAFDALDCNTLASGDADVINTNLILILPCLDQVNVLASITNERIPLVPDTPTMGEIEPQLDISLWNGLFVTKDTPQDVRDRIAEVAAETMASERAQQIAKDTGGLVYWIGAEDSAALIARDAETVGRIGGLLEN